MPPSLPPPILPSLPTITTLHCRFPDSVPRLVSSDQSARAAWAWPSARTRPSPLSFVLFSAVHWPRLCQSRARVSARETPRIDECWSASFALSDDNPKALATTKTVLLVLLLMTRGSGNDLRGFRIDLVWYIFDEFFFSNDTLVSVGLSGIPMHFRGILLLQR